ncbi:TetR/AcrR family transcriptional regulator [Haliea sp.]
MATRTINTDKVGATAAGKKPKTLRNAEKRNQIMAGSLQVFLKHGFHGASIDNIAATAGVSKPTIYSYFKDKEGLFAAIIRDIADRILIPTRETVPASVSVEEALERFTHVYASVMLDPKMLAMHRLAVGEAQRFPKVGELFYRAGPEAALRGIMEYLQIFIDRGDLDIQDLESAAHHFWGLTLNPMRTMMLFMCDYSPSREEVEESIHRGIQAFLAIYKRQ